MSITSEQLEQYGRLHDEITEIVYTWGSEVTAISAKRRYSENMAMGHTLAWQFVGPSIDATYADMEEWYLEGDQIVVPQSGDRGMLRLPVAAITGELTPQAYVDGLWAAWRQRQAADAERDEQMRAEAERNSLARLEQAAREAGFELRRVEQ